MAVPSRGPQTTCRQVSSFSLLPGPHIQTHGSDWGMCMEGLQPAEHAWSLLCTAASVRVLQSCSCQMQLL